MPRRLRIELRGGVYHVINRGVDRTNIVRDDDDRHEWWRLFNRVALRCGWRVFAHVLMTNHFHVFLKLTATNLSTGMHDLESGYATLFNKRHGRTGALFEGRFKAVLVESEGHAWSLSRYIHLNPCRAMRGRVCDFSELADKPSSNFTACHRPIPKNRTPDPAFDRLAEKPEHYRWSTYRHFLDPRDAPKWLDWRTVLCEFAGTEGAARIAYRRYVESGLTQNLPNPLAHAYEGLLLGSASFIVAHRHLIEDAEFDVKRISGSLPIDVAIRLVSETFEVHSDDIQARGRHGNLPREIAIWLCREVSRGSLSDIAAAFGDISASTVTDTIRRCEQRQRRSAEFRQQCEMLRGRVYDFSELADEPLGSR